MAYNPKSLKAEEFISDEEILATLEYAEQNKHNKELIEEILEKASARYVKIKALTQLRLDEIVILKDGKPLEVKETNTPAISLYEKLGFKISHKRKGYYNGVDAIVMIKEM